MFPKDDCCSDSKSSPERETQQRSIARRTWKQKRDDFKGAGSNLEDLLIVALKHASTLEPWEYSLTFYRLYRLASHGKQGWLLKNSNFILLLARLDVCCLGKWSSKDMALVCHALARINVRPSRFFDAVADCFPGLLDRCIPQDISNVVYAFCQLHIQHGELFQAVGSHIEAGTSPTLSNFSPQAVSNTIYSFARLQIRHDGMLTAIARHMPSRLQEFNHQNISNSLYAFAILGFRDEQMLRAVAESLTNERGILDFTPHAICNSVYAFTNLRFVHAGFMGVVANRIRNPNYLRRFTPRDIIALGTSSVVSSWPHRIQNMTRCIRR